MSLYDPHGIYRKNSYYTNKGQIIRQKDIDRPGIIKQYEIPRSIQVLQTYGYLIYPPGYTPPLPPPPPGPEPDPHLYNVSSFFPFILGESYDRSLADSHDYFLSDVWANIRNNFSSLLNIPLERVTYSWVNVSLTSLNIFPNEDIFTIGYPQTFIQFYHNSQSVSHIFPPEELFQDTQTNSLCSVFPFDGFNLNIFGRIISLNTPHYFFHQLQYNQLQLPHGSISSCDGPTLWSQLYDNDIVDDYPLVTTNVFTYGGTHLNMSGYMYVTLRVQSE